MIKISEEQLKTLREMYPEGTRIRLIKMDDIQAPSKGTLGTVKGIDDAGSILTSWDSGGSLSVIYGEDIVEKV